MAWASTDHIQTPGQTVLLPATTAVSTGNWFRVEPRIKDWTIGINQTGSSVGATVTSSGVIEASFDAVTPCETVLGTWSLNGTAGGSPGAASLEIPSSLAGPYPYIRARVVTINASSAASTGTPGGVAVTFSGRSSPN